MSAHFGISISSAGELKELPPRLFAAVEISGETAVAPALKLPAAMHCAVRDLCDPHILEELPGSSFAIRFDFFRMIESRCQAAAALHARRVSFSLPVMRLLNDAAYADAMKELLLGCWGIIARFDLTAALEVRLPGMDAQLLVQWQHFQRSLLFPLHTLWALHPHEPGGIEAAEKLPANFRFDRDLWRLEFDASSGNYLSGKLLSRVNACVVSAGDEPAWIYLSPRASEDQESFQLLARSIREMESLS